MVNLSKTGQWKSMMVDKRIVKHFQDMEKLKLECRRLMDGMYSPTVIRFMMELATRRGRLQQLRDIVGMGWKADDVRRVIMAEMYISPRALMALTSRDTANLIREFPFSDMVRLGNLWQRLRYRLRCWRQRKGSDE